MATNTAQIQTHPPRLHIPASAFFVAMAGALLGWLLLAAFAYYATILS